MWPYGKPPPDESQTYLLNSESITSDIIVHEGQAVKVCGETPPGICACLYCALLLCPRHTPVMTLVVEADARSNTHIQVGDALAHANVARPAGEICLAPWHPWAEPAQHRSRKCVASSTGGVSNLDFLPLHIDARGPIQANVIIAIGIVFAEGAQQIWQEDIGVIIIEEDPRHFRIPPV